MSTFRWLSLEGALVTFGLAAYGLILGAAAHADSTAPVIVAAAPPSELSTALNQAIVALLAVAVPVIGTFLTLALNRLRQKWGMEATAQNTANMESDIKAALNVGITKMLPTIEANGWNSPLVRNAVLTVATDYLRQRFPDRTAQIVAAAQPTGTNPPTVPAVVAVEETLAARLPDAIAVAAASPATPPVKGATP